MEIIETNKAKILQITDEEWNERYSDMIDLLSHNEFDMLLLNYRYTERVFSAKDIKAILLLTETHSPSMMEDIMLLIGNDVVKEDKKLPSLLNSTSGVSVTKPFSISEKQNLRNIYEYGEKCAKRNRRKKGKRKK